MNVDFLKTEKKLGLNEIGLSLSEKKPITVNTNDNSLTFTFNKNNVQSVNNVQMLIDTITTYIVRRKHTGLAEKEGEEIIENLLRVSEIIKIARKRSEKTNNSYTTH